MNACARAARGDILLFLHADTLLPEGAVALLNALETHRDCQWGGFRQWFSGEDLRLRLISRLHHLRFQVSGVVYGDQDLFVRRALFVRAGGFPPADHPEDVRVSERLLAHAQPTPIDERVITDARKFVQRGPWRSLARVFVIMLCYRLRLPIPMRECFEPIR